MLKKTYVKSRRAWRVDFIIPVSELPPAQAESIHIVGTFNNWDRTATPMKYVAKDKAWKGRVYLPPGAQEQFRYYINNAIWYNDWHADGYQPGSFGADNCLVIVPDKP